METPQTLTDLQKQAEHNLATAEAYRREPKSLDTNPVPGTVDYAHSGSVMEGAMGHLRESIPNGQKRRTEQAFNALRRSVQLQEGWLRSKGYDV